MNRNRPFSLQELSRSKILGTGITENEISQMEIPESMKRFLKGQEGHRQEIPDLIEAPQHPAEEEEETK